jgi:predicted O-linked N-acetylglucosamine transferase (SPINDLY family)
MQTPLAPNKDQLLLAEINAAFNSKSYPHVIQLATRFLKKHPNQASVLHQYALSLVHTNRQKEAKTILQRVVALAPNEVLPLFHLARVCHDTGVLFDAKDNYLKIIKRWPDYMDAYAGYGSLLQKAGQLDAAEEIFRQALKIDRTSALNRRNLAVVLRARGDEDEAREIYKTLWETTRSPVAGIELADLYATNKKTKESISIYQEILNTGINQAPAIFGIAGAHQINGDFKSAAAYYEKALELAPDNPDALLKYANILVIQKNYPLAKSIYEKGVQKHPEQPDFAKGLARLHLLQGHPNKSIEIFEFLTKKYPHSAEYFFQLASPLLKKGNLTAAKNALMASLAREPNSLSTYSSLFFLMDSSNAVFHTAQERDRVSYGARMSRMALKHFQHPCKNGATLKIGFLSADFRNHPVGHFLNAVISSIKKECAIKISTYAYYNNNISDNFTQNFKENFSEWREILGMTDQKAEEIIDQDGINILIDLSGHTSGNRIGIFARRTAPVQISWLGYFATTGLNEMDYVLTDPWGQPENSEEFFSEALWPLPQTRLCFTPPDFNTEVTLPPSAQNGHITFGSFNQYLKLNDAVISCWANLLHAVPGSRLFLKTAVLTEPEEQQILAKKFADLGIAASRLLMEGESSREDYLACFSRVDISLDPFPYTGGTTTVESLWMGVPVLTLAGKTLIGRQGLGLLMNAGMADWVAHSPEEYIEIAANWAQRTEELAALRAKLRQQVLDSPLFGAETFAQHFVDAMEQIWAKYVENPVPRPIRWPHYPIDPSYQGTVRIVSATMKSEADFWAEAALGCSLPYHLERDPRIKAQVAFENRRGLSEIFNEAIEAAEENDILVFMHDDVWLDELGGLTQILCEGLKHFDVWGVAGNKARQPGQPGWGHLDDNLTPAPRENFSGRIAHGPDPYGVTVYFGDMPASCELLDGVFLVTQKKRLMAKKVRFDQRFDFHLYDIDFCRTARKAGLKLGTWPIELTHQSHGNFFSERWRQKARIYLKKWGS